MASNGVRVFFKFVGTSIFCKCFYCTSFSLFVPTVCYEKCVGICPTNSIVTYELLKEVSAILRGINSRTYEINLVDICLEYLKNYPHLAITETDQLPIPDILKEALDNFCETPDTKKAGYFMQLAFAMRHHVGLEIVYSGC